MSNECEEKMLCDFNTAIGLKDLSHKEDFLKVAFTEFAPLIEKFIQEPGIYKLYVALYKHPKSVDEIEQLDK